MRVGGVGDFEDAVVGVGVVVAVVVGVSVGVGMGSDANVGESIYLGVENQLFENGLLELIAILIKCLTDLFKI